MKSRTHSTRWSAKHKRGSQQSGPPDGSSDITDAHFLCSVHHTLSQKARAWLLPGKDFELFKVFQRCCANQEYWQCPNGRTLCPLLPCLPCGDCPPTQTPAACASPGTQRGFCLEATCGINLSFSAKATRDPLTLKRKRELCSLTLKGPGPHPLFFLKTPPHTHFFCPKSSRMRLLAVSSQARPTAFQRQITGISLVLTRNFSGCNPHRPVCKSSTYPPCTQNQHSKQVPLL